jgi:hypothetical protein
MKLFCVIIIVFLISREAHAQSTEFDLALKGGLNAATLAHDNRDNRYGFTGGLSGNLQWSVADRFSLAGQIELLYTPRGANAVFNGVMEGVSREHYIDLMLAARPELRFGSVGVYLLLGGGLNFLMSANKDDAGGSGQDITGDLHRIDIALLAGAGVAWHLSSAESGSWHLGTIFLEARHDIGLIDTDLANDGFKNRTSSLMLGLSLAMGGSSARSTSAP